MIEAIGGRDEKIIQIEFTGTKIIRCKDCRFYEEEDFFCHYWENLYEYSKQYPRITPFDFCSRGIRKDEARND